MPYSNIDVEFTELEKTNLEAAITTIKTILTDKVVNLTPEERQQLYKMRSQRASFAQRSMMYALSNPHLIPAYANYAGAVKDYDYYLLSLDWAQKLLGIAESLDDTNKAVGSEVLQFCLIFYNNVKEAARHNVPGSTTIYEDLNTYFDLPPRPEDDVEEP
ncbi:MAG: hypothetical protein IPM47_12370 [Sphingobacteriales bacterium]|nr:MAG: hypothetical protein IPM47_12370 [Sphingobacteriales bacterium]